MKRLNRKEEAVSPVIATILMVAITVVLAATLYMMVGGFGENGDDGVAEAMSSSIERRDDGWMISITGGSVDWAEDRVILFDTDAGVAYESDDYERLDDASPPGAYVNFTADDLGLDDFGGENNDADYLVIRWNDNDDSDSFNSGDTIRITFWENGNDGEPATNFDRDSLDNFELRLRGTTLEESLD